MSLSIQQLELGDSSAVHICGEMMANSEPWITLKRDYDASVKTLSEPSKEVYLARLGDKITGFIILNLQGAFVGYLQTVCVFPEHRGKGIAPVFYFESLKRGQEKYSAGELCWILDINEEVIKAAKGVTV